MVKEKAIQVGDLVSLRTGGPAMTVQARSQNLAYCAWKTDGRLHYGTFEVDNLRAAATSAEPAPRGIDPDSPCA